MLEDFRLWLDSFVTELRFNRSKRVTWITGSLFVVWVTLLVIFLARLSKSGKPTPVKLPPHFSGLGFFVYHEITSGVPTQQIAAQAKHRGFSFGIVKATEGGSWLPLKKDKTPQFCAEVVQSLHQAGLRCYAYNTCWLKFVSPPLPKERKKRKQPWTKAELQKLEKNWLDRQVTQAIVCLHILNADGYVWDDVFMAGSSPKIAKAVLGPVRKHTDECSRCQGKVLAFTTIPHLWRRPKFPWSVFIQHCHYFISQAYWRTIEMSPEQAPVYARQQWDKYIAAKRIKSQCHFLLAGHAFAKQDPAETREMDRFLTTVFPHYRGVAMFRWGIVDPDTWLVLKKWGWKFKEPHFIKNPSRKQ